ncbi:MAG: DNA translocase FtsK [Lachnospiraceae bacterium]|nr:DNA translocase FtsK [Lachnospiraceae bacterium]
MRQVEKIMLVFENCETAVLSVGDMYKSDVYSLHIKDVSKQIRSYALNSVCEVITCSYVSFILNPNANQNMQWSEIDLFECLSKYRDITHIDVMYDDGTDDYIEVPWGDDDYDNKYQSASFLEDGRLKVEIYKSKDRTADDKKDEKTSTEPENDEKKDDQEQLKETAEKLQSALKSLGVGVSVTDIICGHSITRYELTPDAGVRVSSILKLSDDIKRILGVEEIRIEAPIPGKTAVGIEVPNKERSIVTLREMLDSPEFKTHKSNLAFAVGKDIYGQNVIGDIVKMPHLLIAGTEGSGKTVFLNSIIVSLIYHKAPTDVKLLLIDPNIIELKPFNGIPHLIKPVITTIKHACEALAWAVTEMTNRYKLFAENKVMNHSGYNEKVSNAPGGLKPLPQIVIIVSELADLMLSAPTDVEDRIQHIAQMGRAAGIHLILATQHPTPKVLTGSVKANMPSRIALNVASSVYSRNIIDMAGAEKLLGNGDMLYYPVGAHSPVRLQGPLVTEKEIEEIVEHLKNQ